MWPKDDNARSTTQRYSSKKMIKKIFRIPIELLKLALFGIFGILFLCFVSLIFLVLMIAEIFQKERSVDPVIHSKDGKVVDLDDFRVDKTRGES